MNKKSTVEEFIEKSNIIHKNKYDYSRVNYINAHVKVKILCPIHGEFIQSPNHHLGNEGCNKCRYLTLSRRFSKTKDEFIKDSLKIHGNIYNYSKVNYIRRDLNIIIICKKHGEFLQLPCNHLRGDRCPKCSNRISLAETEFLNYMNITDRYYTIHQWKAKKVDGYDKKTNTVYEFLGDYYHGNPKIYNRNDINPTIKRFYGELYDDTLKKMNKVKSLGYNVKYIWENDWKQFKSGKVKNPFIQIL